MSRFVNEINDSPLAAERAEKDVLGNKIDTTYQQKLTAGSNISINEVTNTISAQKTVLWLTYGSTYTKTQVDGWITDGYLLCVSYNSRTYKLGTAMHYNDTNYYTFSDELDYVMLTINDSTSAWTDGSHYPTAASIGAVPSSLTVNGKALSSNITLGALDVGALPGKYIWSGGNHEVYGYKIGESTEITDNGVYCMAMGTLVCTNKFTTDPQTGRNGALFMGFFYIWFYKASGSWTGRMRLFSCNPSLSNTDTYLYHYENGNKVEFFIGFTNNYSSKTMNSKRAVGVGICYNFAQNFNVPASLAEVAQNQPFTEAWSIYKQPYYGQTSEGIGSAYLPVYVNGNGEIVACSTSDSHYYATNSTLTPSDTAYAYAKSGITLTVYVDNMIENKTYTAQVVRASSGSASFDIKFQSNSTFSVYGHSQTTTNVTTFTLTHSLYPMMFMRTGRNIYIISY